jgi:DNA replication protein DnaC
MKYDLNAIINPKQPVAVSNDFVKDGILYCGECRAPKQINLDGLRPILCECQLKARKAADAEAERLYREKVTRYLRETGITDALYRDWTFDTDDGKNPKASETAKAYVNNWAANKANNTGILFSGRIGTGKTFHACCIANELIDKGVRVTVRNASRLIARATDFDDDIYPEIEHAELLIIDDIGTGRSTEYAVETLYNIIDARYRSGKPLIVTTNLTPNEMVQEQDEGKRRTYDRILERCPIRILYNGESRRIEKARGIK